MERLQKFGYHSSYKASRGLEIVKIDVAQGPGRIKPVMQVTVTPYKLFSTEMRPDTSSSKTVTVRTFTQKGAARAVFKEIVRRK